MIFRFPLLLLFASLLATSCKSIHTIDGEYRFSDGYGLVAISTRIDNRCAMTLFSSGAINFYALNGNRTSGLFLLDNSLVQRDFENPPGYFFVRSLPEGDYRLSNISFHGYISRKPLDIPFSVTAGKTKYLGEFSVDVPNCNGFNYRVTDQWERDQNIFRTRVTNLPPASVEKQILPQ
ncbi:MAG TPA: hypothetical protein PLW86_13150 [Rhodocyclaceae bacterium]|nr:hypothetical protein [Rhodocyclaceae bacterium]